MRNNGGTGGLMTDVTTAGAMVISLRSTTAKKRWRMLQPVVLPISAPSVGGVVVLSRTWKKPTVHQTAKQLLRLVRLL